MSKKLGLSATLSILAMASFVALSAIMPHTGGANANGAIAEAAAPSQFGQALVN